MKEYSLKPPNKTKERAVKFLVYAFLIALTLLCIAPFYMMLINSTRASTDINTGLSVIPGDKLGENLTNLLEDVDIFRGLANSATIAVLATILSSYFSALTAYGFAFYNFPGKKVLLVLVMGLMMVPAQLGLIGFFSLVNALGLIDSYIPLIVPAAANAFAVFFLKQYAGSTISKSLIQAARIDGAGELEIFHKIAFPLMLPGVAVMAIFTFVANWNNYITPLVILNSTENYTVPMLIAQLNSTAYKTDFGVVYTGVALSVLPIMIIFAFCSRFLIANIAQGGIKE